MKRALTLIELLVVVAIVGMLTSLLMPVIGSIREASNSTVCRANQRQLILATASYRNEHVTNPPAVTYTQQDGVTTMIAWDDELVLWQYIDQEAKHMTCPNHIITTGSITGYNYNTSFIGSEDYLFTEPVRGVSSSDSAHPAGCAVFGDCNANKFMRSPLPDSTYDPFTDSYTRCAGMQSYRHQGATIVAWLDGHVDVVRTKFTGCDDETDTGFLSEDNAAYDPRKIELH